MQIPGKYADWLQYTRLDELNLAADLDHLISRMLGESDPVLGFDTSLAMTMDLYSHVLPNTKQKEMDNHNQRQNQINFQTLYYKFNDEMSEKPLFIRFMDILQSILPQ